MSKKFDKFSYQLVDSTHKGYQEVLVTFEYKKKPCHYYSFIQEHPSIKKNGYIEKSKQEINAMISNGELVKCAKKYLNYRNSSINKLSTTSKAIQKTTKIRSKKSAWPFLFLSIVGIVLLGLGIISVLRSYNLLNVWPIAADDELSVTVHFYVGIAMGVLGLASLGIGIPFFIKNTSK